MITASSLPQRRTPLIAATAARAVVAAVLAAVVTFSGHHDTVYGFVALGVFGVVFGLVTAAGAARLPALRLGRTLVLARAAVFVLGGVAALLLVHDGLVVLVNLQTAVFLLAGALEVLSGLRPDGPPEVAGDAVVVGGLELLVGVMLVVLDRDAIFTIGVLGAWGAVVAVYLGIAAASLRGKARA